MRRIVGLIAAVIMIRFVWQRESVPPQSTDAQATPSQTQQAPNDRAKDVGASGATQTTVRPQLSGKGFRDRAHLDEHYQKHGIEFPGASKERYLALAQMLRDAPAGGDILEITRPSDGVVSRFDRSSGAFIAFDRDGTIRTFFIPNDGEKYFRRQANRPPSR